MSFRNLILDASKIDKAITKFSLDEKPDIKKKGKGTHYSIKKDSKKALIIFYFNKDGTTTINPNVGPNKEFSNKFCQFIKEECLITNLRHGSISVLDISDNDLKLLFEYIEEIDRANVLDSEERDGFKIYKVKSPYRDVVTLTHYDTKTLLVQGHPLYLFQEIKIFLYGLLPLERVVATESETYKIDIKVDQIRDELKAYMPTAFGFLEDKIIKILTPSLSLRRIDIELEDYSCFVFPALKGIEGYIRQLHQIKGGTETIQNLNRLGAIFNEASSGKWILCEWAKSDIPCVDTCFALEGAYNIYRSKRHPYFHVKNQIATTPIIWKKEDADSLVVEVFETIEKTYSHIPN